MDNKYIVRRGDAMVFVGEEMRVFVDRMLFDKQLAYIQGMELITLGVFPFSVLFGKDGEWMEYNLEAPISITIGFSSTYRTKDKTGAEFEVFVLKSGDEFIKNMNYVKELDSVTKFTNSMMWGKLPSTIDYGNVLNILHNNLSLNDMHLGTPSVIDEIILSELYRDKKNLTKPFRHSYDGSNGLDYKMVSIKTIPQLTSTFAGIMFEDINKQLLSAVVNADKKLVEKETPLEKLVKL